ncbi:MAG: hypothetical protein AAGU11_18715 [Syntrophobacteraceae bacterium]
MDESLFDGESARYKFDEPRRAMLKTFTADTYSAKVFFQNTIATVHCWVVPSRINAKNRMGAYVGWKDYVFFFKNGVLVKNPDVHSYQILD